jgi:hypothetical protein
LIVIRGEVAEWLMAPVLKTGIPERVSGVRIPPSPPDSLVVKQLGAFASLLLNRTLLDTTHPEERVRAGDKGSH